jgi:replicative DNA helicase
MEGMLLRSERLVIYYILSQPSFIHDIMSRLSLPMFQNPITKLIFEHATKLYLEQQPINLLSLYQDISKSNSLNKQNAASELAKLQGEFTIIGAGELNTAIAILIAEDVRHEHIDLAKKVEVMANKDTYDPQDVINVLQSHISDNKFKSLIKRKEMDNESLLKELDQKMLDASTKEGVSGIETGFKRFDVLTSGMQPTNFIIIAARPAMGKTQYALGLMKHASIRNNYKGLFISCEMDEVQVMKRIISVDSGIPGYHIKRGKLETREIMRYEKSKKRIINSNLKIVAGAFTITDILSLVYKMKYSQGLDYVVIDYIQKVQSPGSQNRTNEVGDVSRKLKDMANELKIPVIALAQLSRAVEHRTDKKPMLSDLRESGDIEQDADIVMFLYRMGYYMTPEEKENNSMADDGYAIIAKHRDGELEDIQLTFDSNIPAWKNPYDRDDADDDYVQTALRPNNDFDIF